MRVNPWLLLPFLAGLVLSSALEAQACRPAAALAERLLETGATGGIESTARYAIDEDALDQGRLLATVETAFDLAPLGAVRDFCFAVVVETGEGLEVVAERAVSVERPAGGARLTFACELELPEETAQILTVVEASGSGRWGAAVAADADRDIPGPGAAGAVALAGAGRAWLRLTVDAPAAPLSAAGAKVLRIVPPRRQPATGSTRFDTLVSSREIRRVVFYLDGVEAEIEERRPFVARLPLADPPRPQTVRAVAFDRLGNELGDDEIEVNRLDLPFRVRITSVSGDPASGSVEVAAEVTVPADGELERLVLYRNEEVVETFTAPPYRARVATPSAGPEDFLRVAAYLRDGRSIDDVALLAGASTGEAVDVNLVELRLVVTGADGLPVKDLSKEEISVVFGGREHPLEGLAYADDVPLLLGLVIDTSGSMVFIMDDTRKAAARFLSETLRRGDRAFLVDFAERPRLLEPTTGELAELAVGLGRLRAEGKTALYDAVVFALLQLEDLADRKALVVLSDGDDRDSRYGPKDSVEMARTAGVPVYVIGLGALDDIPRSFPKKELRQLTGETGGGLFFVDTLDQLRAAYARINEELRSQYTVSFYAGRDLTAADLRDLDVRLARPGLQTRLVLGGRR